MYTAVHSYTGYGSSNTFVVGKSQRRYHRNDRVRSRGAMTVQSWRQRWHVSQDHLTKSLVEQAEVGQDSRAHGRAVDARVPMDIDRSSVPSASGVGLETSQGRAPPPSLVRVNRCGQAGHHTHTWVRLAQSRLKRPLPIQAEASQITAAAQVFDGLI